MIEQALIYFFGPTIACYLGAFAIVGLVIFLGRFFFFLFEKEL
jgi:hypothetical protein